MTRPYQVGFIGAGNMAEGIVAGVLVANVFRSGDIIASDPSEDRRRLFEERFGLTMIDDSPKVVASADMVVLAIKPQAFAELTSALSARLRSDQLIVSIMAGWSTAAVAEALGGDLRVVRAMPNLPIRVGAGMTGIAGGAGATEADIASVRRLFDAAGQSVVLDDESLMDAVTAVSGSGPAYYYYVTEAIIASGVEAGLTPEQANDLAKNTCLGAARMMLETGVEPAELRAQVTSKGGTTQAALEAMEAAGVGHGLREGVLAAVARSKELGT